MRNIIIRKLFILFFIFSTKFEDISSYPSSTFNNSSTGTLHKNGTISSNGEKLIKLEKNELTEIKDSESDHLKQDYNNCSQASDKNLSAEALKICKELGGINQTNIAKNVSVGTYSFSNDSQLSIVSSGKILPSQNKESPPLNNSSKNLGLNPPISSSNNSLPIVPTSPVPEISNLNKPIGFKLPKYTTTTSLSKVTGELKESYSKGNKQSTILDERQSTTVDQREEANHGNEKKTNYDYPDFGEGSKDSNKIVNMRNKLEDLEPLDNKNLDLDPKIDLDGLESSKSTGNEEFVKMGLNDGAHGLESQSIEGYYQKELSSNKESNKVINSMSNIDGIPNNNKPSLLDNVYDGIRFDSTNDKIDEETIVYKSSKGQMIDDGSSNVFIHFLTLIVIAVICYLLFHNKHRIIALILEGKDGRNKNRRSHLKYRKLDSNLEETMATTQGSRGQGVFDP